MATPTPLTYTLRLKSHKTTILIHADPLSSFSTIKAALYTALQETSLHDPDTGASIPLPDAPEDIQLGRPVNVNDAGEGFKLGEWEYTGGDEGGEDGEGEEVGGTGKGKAKATANGGGKGKAKKDDTAGLKDCPNGAGLKDGSVLAFRWRGEGMWDGEEEEEEEEEEGDMWGVKLASFEDAYGVENGGDVGA